MPITRTAMIDDDGSGLTGTIIDNPWKTELYNQIDAADVAANSTQLLHAAAGNTTLTGGQNLDLVSISGLTALDWLEVFWHLQNGSVANANPVKFATTNEYIGQLVPSIAAGTVAQGHSIIRQGVSQPLACGCLSEGMMAAARVDSFQYAAITVAWTATWTLALQALGLPAGGSLNWAWNVYRRKGQ
jgi:hypothetical protein